jgi:Raf kinase inhibitor-like YbhB/YbcL family protein
MWAGPDAGMHVTVLAQAPGSSNLPFSLTSAAFVENAVIPVRYSGDGENVSPPLAWRGAPAGTQSFVLTLVDPDVPFGEEVPVYGLMPPPGTVPGDLFIHWIVADIPAGLNSLSDGASPGNMPAGARELSSSFALFGAPANQYGGPAPPPQLRAHAYKFTLYALDVPALESLAPDSDHAALTEAMAGHVLSTATLMGYFGH